MISQVAERCMNNNLITLDQLKKFKGQKFLFLNVRSIYKHISEIQADFNGTDFVAIGMVETWLNSNLLLSMIKLDGYKIVRLDRQVPKRGGGVMLYIRDKCNWELLPNLSLVSTNDIEVLSIILKRSFMKDECLSVVYVPPNGDKNVALEKLDEIADLVFGLGYQWTLAGDFNIDLKKTNCSIKKKLELFAHKNALVQLIKKFYT